MARNERIVCNLLLYFAVNFIIYSCGKEIYVGDFVEEAGIIYYRGTINWENGAPVSSDTRLRTDILKYDHDIYVGLARPINDVYRNNYLVYSIHMYQDGKYIGTYNDIEQKLDYNSVSLTDSYTKYNTLIPANTEFAISIRYTDENTTALYNQTELLSNIGEIFRVGNSPLYYDVPSYYFENDYLDNKINDIRTIINECEGDTDIFIRITDIHFDRNQQHSPALIKYISERVAIPRMFNCGDDFDGGNLNVYNIFKHSFNGDFYFCVGNHDVYTNGNPNYSYDDVALAHWNECRNAIWGNQRLGYYYVDNEKDKVRYIILNSIGELGTNSSYITEPYDEEQMSWLVSSALQVNSGWTIVIFVHQLLYRPDPYNSYAMSIVDYGQRLINVIDSYNGVGIIAGIFCGDDHQDRIWLTPNKHIPVIMSVNDGIGAFQNHYDTSQKIPGTIGEQAFDVVIIDKNARCMKILRVGAKAYDGVGLEDNRGRLVEIRNVSY